MSTDGGEHAIGDWEQIVNMSEHVRVCGLDMNPCPSLG